MEEPARHQRTLDQCFGRQSLSMLKEIKDAQNLQRLLPGVDGKLLEATRQINHAMAKQRHLESITTQMSKDWMRMAEMHSHFDREMSSIQSSMEPVLRFMDEQKSIARQLAERTLYNQGQISNLLRASEISRMIDDQVQMQTRLESLAKIAASQPIQAFGYEPSVLPGLSQEVLNQSVLTHVYSTDIVNPSDVKRIERIKYTSIKDSISEYIKVQIE